MFSWVLHTQYAFSEECTDTSPCLSFSSLQFMTFNKSLGNAVCFNNNYSNIFPPLMPQKMQTEKGRKGRINFKGSEQLHLHFEMCSHKSLTICNVCSSFIYIYISVCVCKGFSCYKTINMTGLKTFKVVWWLLFLWKSAEQSASDCLSENESSTHPAPEIRLLRAESSPENMQVELTGNLSFFFYLRKG